MKPTFCCLAVVVGLTFQAAAESSTTNILDGVTTNAAGPFTLGDTGPFNFLLITNGGVLSNAVGTIGNSNAAFGNVAIVTGPGSVWANEPSLTIGVRGASNQVSVLDGARLASSVAVGIGTYDTSTGNRLLVSGANSRFEADRLFLGTYSSDNTFVVQKGAHSRLNTLVVNSESSPVGRHQILIRDAGTLVTIDGTLSVSRSPANLVSVSDNATLRVRSCDFGSLPSGRGNRLDAFGSGTLMVVSNGLSIGSVASSNVAVFGDFAELWVQRIDVGGGSAGNQLHVGNGARVFSTLIPNANASLAIGTSASGQANLVSLQGAGTIWSNSGYVFVGTSGSRNAMILSDGAAFSDSHAGIGGITVGDLSGSSNNLLRLTGAGTALTSRHRLTIGRSGSQNLLLLDDSARLVTGFADIGESCLARDNLALITGAGTVWSNGWLHVGYCSTNNHLVVSNGAQVFVGSVLTSVQGGASNTITVTGSGSLLRATDDVMVGNTGVANWLTIAAGAQVHGRYTIIGFSGRPTQVTSNCSLNMGGNTVLVTDPGSRLESSFELTVGGQSHANLLMIRNGASLKAANIRIGASSGPSCGLPTHLNVLTVSGGCLLATNQFGSGRINPLYGTFRMLSGLTEVDSLGLPGGPWAGCEILGGTLRVKQLFAYTGSRIIVGDGVHRARVDLNNGHTDITGAMIIAPRSLITGRGSLSGFITNQGVYGDLSGPPCNLTLQGNPLARVPGGYDIVLAGREPGLTYSRLTVNGVAVFGGRLRVALRGGFRPTTGEPFQVLLYGSRSNEFVNAPHGARLKTTDNLGSFVINYLPTALLLDDYQSTDLDGDAIEDAWATNHFGHSPLTATEKLADADGDGASNYDEFRAGTDPNDPASALSLSIAYAGSAATVSFPCVDGKEYRVWSSNDLETWMEVTDPTFAYPSSGRCEWTDDGKDTGGVGATSRFYRVTVE